MRDRMLGSVFRKTIRDWLLPTIVAVVAMWLISLLYIVIMGSSGDAYVTMLNDLPDVISNIYGQHDGSAAGLAMSGIYFLIGPLVLLAYAIGLGSSAAVGEEEARTLPILLSSPLRRRSVLLAKTAVVVIGVVVITVLTWLGVVTTSAMVDLDLSGQDVVATSIQLLGMVLLFGALALGVSAWRGSSALGVSVAAGIAVASYFATTLLPVIEQLADVARLTPWYLFSGADALRSGVDITLLALASVIAIMLFAMGALMLDRRDLKA